MHVALQQQKLWYDRGPGWLISKPSRFPARSGVKNLSANAGEMSSIPGLGRTPRGGHGYLLYSCLGNPKDREAWWATVHGVAKNRTRLSNQTTTILSVSHRSFLKANTTVGSGSKALTSEQVCIPANPLES